ncbi:MAG: hypothetical protein F6K09_29985 [Merismopedia sp. SIO2A8]|nr:hypothetical protein [Symploca sp. SIO2B6]NET52755.1 hypothetical protein [Merismopedia sp. SIO2A8]
MKSTTLATDALLSMMTVPLLVGVLGAKTMAEAMQGLGQTSEELFRGDRLPLLAVSSLPARTDTTF